MNRSDIARWCAYYDGMTLGAATERRRQPGIACACAGPVILPAWSGAPCSCMASALQASALQRAAHIVAKLVQSAAEGD